METIRIIMQSGEFGREQFGPYETWDDAYAAMTRLRAACEGDGIERIIGFVVNEVE